MANRTVVTAFPLLARTATPTVVGVEVPLGATQLLMVINATAIAATPSVVFNIRGRVPGTTTVYTSPNPILASAAITAVSATALIVGPDIVAVANLAAQANLPLEIEIAPVHGDADSITYSVTCIFT